MKKICHNSISAIYDDGNKWVWKAEDGQDDQVLPKKQFPLFPLSAVIKYEMEVDDEETINKLRKEALKGDNP